MALLAISSRCEPLADLSIKNSNVYHAPTISSYHRLRPSVSARFKEKIWKIELISELSGLGAIEQFKRKGFDVVAYEARDSVGGLWLVGPDMK